MTSLTADGKKRLARTVGELRPLLLRDVRAGAALATSVELPGAADPTARERAVDRAIRATAATFLYRRVLRRQLDAIDRAAAGAVPSDEHAAELIGASGDQEAASHLSVSLDAQRLVDDRLDDPDLHATWLDATTLGWVHQFWNDPDRAAIDARLEAQGKLEAGDIATKTQLFTERYMVEWLLQNSLGHAWLCLCARNGWRPDAASVIDSLAARRAEWQRRVRTGEVGPDAVMPIADASERAWQFYLPRPVTAPSVERSPCSVGELRLLDPACGTGHFLVAAFDMLVAMHREEARHRGEARSDAAIAQAILARNLHGVDIDARAVELAAAALALKACALGARTPSGCANLVATASELGSLHKGDGVLEERTFDLVVGNPPYFGTQSLGDSSYLDRVYPESKENLCTAMVDRAMELVRPGGRLAFVTARSWLYVSQLTAFRRRFLAELPPCAAADLGLGGFDSAPGVEVVLWVAEAHAGGRCTVVVADQPGVEAKVARLRCPGVLFETEPAALVRLPGSPFAYRWSAASLRDYLGQSLLGAVAPVRVGMKTSDNLRFLRRPWELAPAVARRAAAEPRAAAYVPYVKGAAGKAWIEPLSDLVDWRDEGLGIRVALDSAYRSRPQGEAYFFQPAVAFSTIGRRFVARAHRYRSIFDVAGSSVVTAEVPATVCLLNSRRARAFVEALNPTVNFQVGDVARIPLRCDPDAATIFRELEQAFALHEEVDELSFRFRMPGPTAWPSAQQWAQTAVDRADGAPLPPRELAWDAPAAESHVSFAVGVALGRFGEHGEGLLDHAPVSALPAGILFVAKEGPDSVDHAACALLRSCWAAHGDRLTGGHVQLRAWLRRSFAEAHRRRYEGRPIYLPLASRRRSFVAHVSIHRWTEETLPSLVADHLAPARARLGAERDELRRALAEGRAERRDAKRAVELERLLGELAAFTTAVQEAAEQGPPAVGPTDPPRERAARFAMVLDDGVMLNAAALWPLCEPLWKEPKKWWQQLARRSGPKGCHFDWSQTAARYYPSRVADCCARDPVMAVAHRCLWACHPAEAYRFEHDLRRAVRPDFRIEEPDADELRARFVRQRPDTARTIEAVAAKRTPARRRAVTTGDRRRAD